MAGGQLLKTRAALQTRHRMLRDALFPIDRGLRSRFRRVGLLAAVELVQRGVGRMQELRHILGCGVSRFDLGLYDVFSHGE